MEKVRLDVYLAKTHPKLSRNEIKRMILERKVRVDGHPKKPSAVLRGGEKIEIQYSDLPRPDLKAPAPEPIPLDIIYEDKAILVLNKPAGLVVHPAAGNWTGTLVNAVLYHLRPSPPANTETTIPLSRQRERVTERHGPSPLGGRGQWHEGGQKVGEGFRPGIVHRLDKGTSGVMVIAKTDAAQRSLSQQFKKRQVKKTYLAMVFGKLSPKEGTIESAIGRDPYHRRKFSSHARHKREAVTHYKVVKELKDLSLLEVSPETGRTHQIRVHLSEAGHPIVGDLLYGTKSLKERFESLSRPFLHAGRLQILHPDSKEIQVFSAPLPPELEAFLRQFT